MLSRNKNRRSFLKSVVAGSGLLLVPSPIRTFKLQKKSRQLSVFIDQDFTFSRPWLLPNLQQMGKNIFEQSNGELSLQFILDSNSPKPKNLISGYISSPSLLHKNVLSFLLGHFPLGLRTEEKWQWMQSAEVQSLYTENSLNHLGSYPLLISISSENFGLVSHLDCLDERVASKSVFSQSHLLSILLYRNLGLKTRNLKNKNIEKALWTKTVDVSEAFSPEFWVALDFFSQPGFYYYSGHWIDPIVLEMRIYSSIWTGLNRDEQLLLRKNAYQISANMIDQSQKWTRQNLQIITRQTEIKSAPFLQNMFAKSYEEIFRKYLEKNPQIQKLLNLASKPQIGLLGSKSNIT